jgi:hypothetical protein
MESAVLDQEVIEGQEVNSDVDTAVEIPSQDIPAVEQNEPVAVVVDYEAAFADIAKCEAECAEAESEFLQLKEETKEAKARYEVAVSKLRQACRAAENDKDRPLFNQPTKADSPAAEPSEEGWRVVDINELCLQASIVEKLAEVANVTTLGGLEDFRAKIALGEVEWPKGIGVAKITAIEESIANFLDEYRWRDTKEVPVSEPEETDGE